MRAVRIFSSLLLVAALASSALGCDSSKGGGAVEAAVTAAPLTVEECSACGMVVAEQPAPRVQVVHRDGERMFLCSVGDSVHHLADGSRHGAAKGVFVEVLDPAADPTVTDPTKRPWRDATKSSFVVGVKRQGVMGPRDEARAGPTKPSMSQCC